MSKSIQLDGKEILHNIELAQRTPFMQLLATYLDCVPDRATIAEFAKQYPDRYFKVLALITPLAGYNETVVHEHNHLVEIHGLSDAEIILRRQQLMKKMEEFEGEYEKKDNENG